MGKLKTDVRAHLALWTVVGVSVALYFLGKQFSQDEIQRFVESAGPWAPVVWILAHQVSYILAPVSGYPFMIVGFYLFGNTTIFYNFIVAVVGSSINFWLAKKWGRPIVAKFAGREALAKIDKVEKEYGLGTLFLIRLFLIGLGDIISYAYGLTPIKYSTFIGISVLGFIPSYIIWYFIAAKTGNIEQFLGVSVALTTVATLIFIVGSYLKKKFF